MVGCCSGTLLQTCEIPPIHYAIDVSVADTSSFLGLEAVQVQGLQACRVQPNRWYSNNCVAEVLYSHDPASLGKVVFTDTAIHHSIHNPTMLFCHGIIVWHWCCYSQILWGRWWCNSDNIRTWAWNSHSSTMMVVLALTRHCGVVIFP